MAQEAQGSQGAQRTENQSHPMLSSDPPSPSTSSQQGLRPSLATIPATTPAGSPGKPTLSMATTPRRSKGLRAVKRSPTEAA